MEVWAIVPEMILAGAVLVLLPLGPFLPPRRKAIATWAAFAGLGAALAMSAAMLAWGSFPIFEGTYAVDPFAVYFKLFAIATTCFVLMATHSHFQGRPHAGEVPALLVLTCLGMVGLAASQDLVLIALFIQLITVGSYTLVGIAKESRLATEGAVKLFLFSAASSAVMLYGMSLLYGLTGSLRLPEIAARLPEVSAITSIAVLGLVVVGYGFKITLVPFHGWAPDTYQGAPTPISGFLAVGPKAAGLAVLLRTLDVAYPGGLGAWPVIVAALAALTMTVGNVFALRQTSAKRLLAYSSIGQAGYLLVGVAAAQRDPLAVPAFLFYLAVYLSMNLASFLAVDAIERHAGSDDLRSFRGLGFRQPLAAAALALGLLSLAGLPPLGGFVGKAMLFGAAIGAGWGWLAAFMAANVALSLFYYVRVIEPLYLYRPEGAPAPQEPPLLRLSLVLLAVATVVSGVMPQPWVALAGHASQLLGAGGMP